MSTTLPSSTTNENMMNNRTTSPTSSTVANIKSVPTVMLTTPAKTSSIIKTKPESVPVSVCVYVRPRPTESAQDAEEYSCFALDTEHGKVQVLDGSEKQYEFDGVLAQDCSQAEVYERVVQPLVAAVLLGYNATVLAYGQTNSGKTYTMGTAAGTEGGGGESEGILSRVLADLLPAAETRKTPRKSHARNRRILNTSVRRSMRKSAMVDSAGTPTAPLPPDGGTPLLPPEAQGLIESENRDGSWSKTGKSGIETENSKTESGKKIIQGTEAINKAGSGKKRKHEDDDNETVDEHENKKQSPSWIMQKGKWVKGVADEEKNGISPEGFAHNQIEVIHSENPTSGEEIGEKVEPITNNIGDHSDKGQVVGGNNASDKNDITVHNNKRVIKLTFLEVYNEKVFDLLSSSRTQLVTKPDYVGGIHAAGCIAAVVTSGAAARRLVAEAAQRRSVSATAMNTQSSRSHALVSLQVTSGTRSSVLWLVDLAGSECVGRMNAPVAGGGGGGPSKVFGEGVAINKGLLALGKVLTARAANSVHVPYRDSLLTHLLRESVEGNSRTAMIACVSLANAHAAHTHTVLRYAEQTRDVRTRPVLQPPASTTRLTIKRGRQEDPTATLDAWRKRYKHTPFKPTLPSSLIKKASASSSKHTPAVNTAGKHCRQPWQLSSRGSTTALPPPVPVYHNTTVSTPGHTPSTRPPKRPLNNTFQGTAIRPQLELDCSDSKQPLASPLGFPSLRQPLFEEEETPKHSADDHSLHGAFMSSGKHILNDADISFDSRKQRRIVASSPLQGVQKLPRDRNPQDFKGIISPLVSRLEQSMAGMEERVVARLLGRINATNGRTKKTATPRDNVTTTNTTIVNSTNTPNALNHAPSPNLPGTPDLGVTLLEALFEGGSRTRGRGGGLEAVLQRMVSKAVEAVGLQTTRRSVRLMSADVSAMLNQENVLHQQLPSSLSDNQGTAHANEKSATVPSQQNTTASFVQQHSDEDHDVTVVQRHNVPQSGQIDTQQQDVILSALHHNTDANNLIGEETNVETVGINNFLMPTIPPLNKRKANMEKNRKVENSGTVNLSDTSDLVNNDGNINGFNDPLTSTVYNSKRVTRSSARLSLHLMEQENSTINDVSIIARDASDFNFKRKSVNVVASANDGSPDFRTNKVRRSSVFLCNYDIDKENIEPAGRNSLRITRRSISRPRVLSTTTGNTTSSTNPCNGNWNSDLTSIELQPENNTYGSFNEMTQVWQMNNTKHGNITTIMTKTSAFIPIEKQNNPETTFHHLPAKKVCHTGQDNWNSLKKNDHKYQSGVKEMNKICPTNEANIDDVYPMFDASLLSFEVSKRAKRRNCGAVGLPIRRSVRVSAIHAIQKNRTLLGGASPLSPAIRSRRNKQSNKNTTVSSKKIPAVAVMDMTTLAVSPSVVRVHTQQVLETLNGGTLKQLQQLATVGVKTAVLILKYRQFYGCFASVAAVANVAGLPATFSSRFIKANMLLV